MVRTAALLSYGCRTGFTKYEAVQYGITLADGRNVTLDFLHYKDLYVILPPRKDEADFWREFDEAISGDVEYPDPM